LELAYRQQGEVGKKKPGLLGLNHSASLISQLYIYVFNFSDLCGYFFVVLLIILVLFILFRLRLLG
jgi:hypothetical protein